MDKLRQGESIEGILVTQQNSSKIVALEDLSTYTPLHIGLLLLRLHAPYVGKIETIWLFLNKMFGGIEDMTSEGIEIDESADVETKGGGDI